jgi:hypothetical protein
MVKGASRIFKRTERLSEQIHKENRPNKRAVWASEQGQRASRMFERTS